MVEGGLVARQASSLPLRALLILSIIIIIQRTPRKRGRAISRRATRLHVDRVRRLEERGSWGGREGEESLLYI